MNSLMIHHSGVSINFVAAVDVVFVQVFPSPLLDSRISCVKKKIFPSIEIEFIMITIKQSNLRCELRDELTWPRPLQPGVGHFNIVSCMASTIESNDKKKSSKI